MRATLPSRNRDLPWGGLAWLVSNRKLLLSSLFVFLVYYLGAQISSAFRIPDSSISIVWISNSILLASLLLSPVRFWWIIFAAVLPAHYIVQSQNNAPVWMILWTYGAICVLALTSAGLLRKFSGGSF